MTRLSILMLAVAFCLFNQQADGQEINAYDLYKHYRENQVRANQDYKGKLIVVTGIVYAVKEKYVELVDSPGSKFGGIQVYLQGKSKESMVALKKGQKIRIKGICAGRDEIGYRVQITNAELVDGLELPTASEAIKEAITLLKQRKANTDNRADQEKLGKAIAGLETLLSERPDQHSRTTEPTDEQLQAAVRAFEKKGCKLFKHMDSVTKRTTYFFELPKEGADLDLANLPDVPFSFGLVIPETRVTEAGLKQLAKKENLTELLVGGLYLTDSGLKEVAKFKCLKTLSSLSDCPQVTDAGLKILTSLNSLTDLDLMGTKITNEGLKEIGHFKNLTAIGLGGSQVTDVGLKEIGKAQHLTGLGLAGTKITDAGLIEVVSLKNLTKLNLFNTKVTDEGSKELPKLTNLVLLDLRGTQVTDAGLAELRKALPKAKIMK